MATWTAGPVLMGVAGKTDRKSSEGTAVEQVVQAIVEIGRDAFDKRQRSTHGIRAYSHLLVQVREDVVEGVS